MTLGAQKGFRCLGGTRGPNEAAPDAIDPEVSGMS